MAITPLDIKHLEIMARLKSTPLPPQKPINLNLSPSKSPPSLIEKLLTLSSKLRSSGFDKYADNLEQKYAIFQYAANQDPKSLYNAHTETGEELLDQAHPDGDVEMAPAQDHQGDVETLTSKHKKILDAIDVKEANKSSSLNKSAQTQPAKSNVPIAPVVNQFKKMAEDIATNVLDGMPSKDFRHNQKLQIFYSLAAEYYEVANHISTALNKVAYGALSEEGIVQIINKMLKGVQLPNNAKISKLEDVQPFIQTILNFLYSHNPKKKTAQSNPNIAPKLITIGVIAQKFEYMRSSIESNFNSNKQQAASPQNQSFEATQSTYYNIALSIKNALMEKAATEPQITEPELIAIIQSTVKGTPAEKFGIKSIADIDLFINSILGWLKNNDSIKKAHLIGMVKSALKVEGQAQLVPAAGLVITKKILDWAIPKLRTTQSQMDKLKDLLTNIGEDKLLADRPKIKKKITDLISLLEEMITEQDQLDENLQSNSTRLILGKYVNDIDKIAIPSFAQLLPDLKSLYVIEQTNKLNNALSFVMESDIAKSVRYINVLKSSFNDVKTVINEVLKIQTTAPKDVSNEPNIFLAQKKSEEIAKMTEWRDAAIKKHPDKTQRLMDDFNKVFSEINNAENIAALQEIQNDNAAFPESGWMK